MERDLQGIGKGFLNRRLVHIPYPVRCLDGADADPLGVHALVLTFVAGFDHGSAFDHLAGDHRALGQSRAVRPVVAHRGLGERPGILEACARTFVLVLLSLLGLLALGLMYGNVLGATNVSNP